MWMLAVDLRDMEELCSGRQCCRIAPSGQDCDLVTGLVEGGPADRGGVRVGDLILELDGQGVASAADLQQMMTAELIERPVETRIWRSGDQLSLELVPAELSEDGP